MNTLHLHRLTVSTSLFCHLRSVIAIRLPSASVSARPSPALGSSVACPRLVRRLPSSRLVHCLPSSPLVRRLGSLRLCSSVVKAASISARPSSMQPPSPLVRHPPSSRPPPLVRRLPSSRQPPSALVRCPPSSRHPPSPFVRHQGSLHLRSSVVKAASVVPRRVFTPGWKDFLWIEFDSAENSMRCTWCVSQKRDTI